VMLAATRAAQPNRESFDVIVIGGGQAGLSVGYYLAQTGLRFAILDANARIGDAWRKRWDSLRVFTPASLDGLDGMPFPGPRDYFPTKDEMADYLEAYAARFRLAVRTGVRVQRLYRRDGRFIVQAGAQEFDAGQVVIAMTGYQHGKLPAFASELARETVQMHSQDYRNVAQLQPGPVLLVGAGNSGADIAMETARAGHPTLLSGQETGEIPFRPDSVLGRHLLGPLLLRFAFHRVLTVRTPMGRKARPKLLHRGVPLIRVKARDLAKAKVQRVPRGVGVRDGKPLLADGRALDVANVIWCGGFHAGFDWIDLPIFDAHKDPQHRSGVVENVPGLYFVGLHFLHAMSSSMIHGVGRDAKRIVRAVAARGRRLAGTSASPEESLAADVSKAIAP